MEKIIVIGITIPIHSNKKNERTVTINIYRSIYINELNVNLIKYNIVHSLAPLVGQLLIMAFGIIP